MLSYYPNTVFPTTKDAPALRYVKVNSDSDPDPAKIGRNTHNSILTDGRCDQTNHMNGRTVSDRKPVLGPGYKIVKPPAEAQPRRSKMAPSSPDSGKAETKVKLKNDGASDSQDEETLPSDSLIRTEEAHARKPRLKLLRSQSTQTDDICSSNQEIVLNRTSTPPASSETRCPTGETTSGSSGPFVSASWSAKPEGPDDSADSDGGPGSEADLVVSARNPVEDYPLSVILVGDSGTGKTCLVGRLADNVFVENYDVTVGIDFNIARFTLPDGRRIRLQLWDTAGQEKYRAITSSYYRKAMGVVFVYDVTRRESLDNILQVWRAEVDQYAESDVELMLIGNKMDLDDYRTVTTRVGVKVAAQLGAKFFEVSAKEDLHVRSAFEAFAQDVIENVCSHRNPCLSPNAVHIGLSNHDRQDQKTGGACNC